MKKEIKINTTVCDYCEKNLENSEHFSLESIDLCFCCAGVILTENLKHKLFVSDVSLWINKKSKDKFKPADVVWVNFKKDDNIHKLDNVINTLESIDNIKSLEEL